MAAAILAHVSIAAQTQQGFFETFKNIDNEEKVYNLSTGTWENNLADDEYTELAQSAFGEWGAYQDEGLEVVLSDNGSQAPYDFE